MSNPILSLKQARRIAIDAQALGAERETDLLSLIRRIRCVQYDPINAVARTQMLVLFSRLGPWDPAQLDKAVYEDKELFHYWAHAASYVLIEDYPIHAHLMKSWPPEGKWRDQVNSWMDEHKKVQQHILRKLKSGPKSTKELATEATMTGWESTGWNVNQTLTRMLEFMWTKGKITIGGRQGLERIWVRADEWFLPEARSERITRSAATELSVVHSLHALGVATERQITQHFTRDQYPELPKILAAMVKKGVVTEVTIKDLPKTWYMLTKDLGLIDYTAKGWKGRTSLLSPFDNLIADRARTSMLFDFDYTIEIYVPKDKRKYGYYVLPILDGGEVVGRIDSAMDRKTGVYTINNLYLEPGFEGKMPAARRTRTAIEALGTWLGATEVAYGKIAPSWKPAFKG